LIIWDEQKLAEFIGLEPTHEGLGLSIADGILKEHVTRVEARSEWGVGCEIKMIFPEATA